MYFDYNLCRTIYLEQELKNNDDYTLFSYLQLIPTIAFYSMFGYYTAKFINYIQNNDTNTIQDEYDEKEIQSILVKHNKISKNYKYQFPDNKLKLLNEVSLDTNTSENENESENEIKKKQTILDNMLSKKTLERALVIYYIFVKKGNYKVITKNKETNELSFEEYNSNLEYASFCGFLVNPAVKDIAKNILDCVNDTSKDNKSFFIGTKEYIINEVQLIIISWLYYSGLYEYLTTNIQLKYW